MSMLLRCVFPFVWHPFGADDKVNVCTAEDGDFGLLHRCFRSFYLTVILLIILDGVVVCQVKFFVMKVLGERLFYFAGGCCYGCTIYRSTQTFLNYSESGQIPSNSRTDASTFEATLGQTPLNLTYNCVGPRNSKSNWSTFSTVFDSIK